MNRNISLLKRIASIVYAIAFGCAFLLLINRTYGFGNFIRITFYISGAAGLIMNFIIARLDETKSEFNLLFWLGSLLLFLGLVAKTYYLPFDLYFVFGGMGLTGISYFFNPFSKESKDESELLDQ